MRLDETSRDDATWCLARCSRMIVTMASQHAGENSRGRPAGFQLLSTEPDFMTRSYSFLGYVRSQPYVFISAGIGDFL